MAQFCQRNRIEGRGSSGRCSRQKFPSMAVCRASSRLDFRWLCHVLGLVTPNGSALEREFDVPMGHRS